MDGLDDNLDDIEQCCMVKFLDVSRDSDESHRFALYTVILEGFPGAQIAEILGLDAFSSIERLAIGLLHCVLLASLLIDITERYEGSCFFERARP